MRRDWTQIDGWLLDVEGWRLQGKALNRRVLELGAYKGRSTACMAATAVSVTSVDWHQGSEDLGDTDTLAEYLGNIAGYDNVVPLVGRVSHVAAYLLPVYDGCFVDAGHDEPNVRTDLSVALEKVVPGGWIAFHDFTNDSFDVGRVCREMLGEPDELVDWTGIYWQPHARALERAA
jgi:hypothetical protein